MSLLSNAGQVMTILTLSLGRPLELVGESDSEHLRNELTMEPGPQALRKPLALSWRWDAGGLQLWGGKRVSMAGQAALLFSDDTE